MSASFVALGIARATQDVNVGWKVSYPSLTWSLALWCYAGVIGPGIGKGAPHYIPLAHSDFVFPAISVCSYAQVIAIGVCMLIAVQTTVNPGGVLGILPLTGVTLRVISYGGVDVGHACGCCVMC